MQKTISEIKLELAQTDHYKIEELLSTYENDNRKGVQQLIRQYKSKQQLLKQEYNRLENMKEFEYKYSHYKAICGIDEVGRGPLAGPVVAGAVILPKNSSILYINDSKKLNKTQREQLYKEIMEKAISTGIGIVPPTTIDEKNILQATYEAMRIAISQLRVEPDLLLNDAVCIPLVKIKQISLIKGDERSISIAAASIIAKVTRDCIMEQYNIVYPQYQFASNKGYGTAVHIQALKQYGSCPIHRNTFIKNFIT